MEIQIPQKGEWQEVNRLAKQVHELHVKWRPDSLFDENIDNGY